jgi:putative Mn2+ efflux pump MntP
MPIWEIMLVALGLSMDAVAVCIVAATSGHVPNRRAAFRLAFHFGLFQFLMPVLGWAAGAIMERHFARWDHWIAFGLLAVVGSRMIVAALRPETKAAANDPTRGLTLVMLSTATSLDALAVGLSLALLGVSVWYPSAWIGLITGGMCVLAIALGNRLRSAVGRWAEVTGGVVLWLIGLKIVVNHL